MAIEPTRASWDSTPQGVSLAEAVLAAHTRIVATILDSPDAYRAKLHLRLEQAIARLSGFAEGYRAAEEAR
jgi:hypothetical protein